MGKGEEKHAPIRQSVHVDCPVEEAFRLFTEGIWEWWPLARYSESGEEAEHCAVEPWVGGRVFERTRSGEEREWGSVTVWDPPGRVEFTWQGKDQSVSVEFDVEADGTRVTLTHTGWQLSEAAVCLADRSVTASLPEMVTRH